MAVRLAIIVAALAFAPGAAAQELRVGSSALREWRNMACNRGMVSTYDNAADSEMFWKQDGDPSMFGNPRPGPYMDRAPFSSETVVRGIAVSPEYARRLRGNDALVRGTMVTTLCAWWYDTGVEWDPAMLIAEDRDFSEPMVPIAWVDLSLNVHWYR